MIFACLENGKMMKHIENKGFFACLENGMLKKGAQIFRKEMEEIMNEFKEVLRA